MFLNKIKLKNIRSYVDAEIIFPKGTTLLSGDIGSGKSTILLAIEFVLFGLKKGKGAGLLRNGAEFGSAELNFDLDGRDVSVKRVLKRSKDKIGQESGFLDGENISATELKQRILDLLNYPMEMLTKDSMIYRYTVYTPQEEMKRILLGDKDSRLDTLRKVFGIDKYKRIRENSEVFNCYLRERIKELDGRLFDLEAKQKEFEMRQKEFEMRQKEFEKIKPEFYRKNEEVEYFKNKTASLELSVKSLNNFKSNLEVCRAKLGQDEKSIAENKLKLKGIKPDCDGSADSKKIKILEEEVLSLRNLINTLQVKIRNCEDIKNKICSLDKCPTCEQNVLPEYKNIVVKREDEKINDFSAKLEKHKQGLALKEKEFSELQRACRENEINSRLKGELIKRNNILENEVLELKQDINELEHEVKRLDGIEKDYEFRKKELDRLVEERRKIEIRKTMIESNVNNLKEILDVLDNEINEKLKCRNEKEKWSKIQYFLKEQFLNLMQEMEKSIMLKVYANFNLLFANWFNMIISGELLNVKLDDEFSPVIEQNGHEIDYIFLSGGEKTAIALAYRLALNQVINSLMNTIKTKDLLILDEPTDGFSSEQLDKVRNVLNELNIGQIIIVSHDSKVESFVENVLKLEKRGHVSCIVKDYHNL